MYEYVILCLECGSHGSLGGLDTPPALSDSEVQQKVIHNPGCRIKEGEYDPDLLSVAVSKRAGDEPGVTVYSMAMVQHG